VTQLEYLLDAVRPLLPSKKAKQPSAPQHTPLTAERLDVLLDRLRPALLQARRSHAPIDVWRVAGLRRREVRNAAALAWLLDPQEDHHLGVEPLHALLDLLESRDPSWRPDRRRLVRAGVHTERRPLGSARDRIDVVVQGEDFLLFLELKIDAVQGPQQLARYLQTVRGEAAVRGLRAPLLAYLTRNAQQSPEAGVAPLTWDDLASALRRRLEPLNPNPVVGQLLAHFSAL